MKIPGLDGVKQMQETMRLAGEVSKNQQEQVRLQVEHIVIQTTLMQRWAEAEERIAVALEKIVEYLDLAESKKKFLEYKEKK